MKLMGLMAASRVKPFQCTIRTEWLSVCLISLEETARTRCWICCHARSLSVYNCGFGDDSRGACFAALLREAKRIDVVFHGFRLKWLDRIA